MSLDWNVSRIKDHETLCFIPDEDDPENKRMNPVTNALIWYTMILDLGEIVPKNVDEWFVRMWIHDQMFSPLMDNSRQITYEDILQHVGLKTNVINRNRAQWFTRMKRSIISDADQVLRRTKRERTQKEITHD